MFSRKKKYTGWFSLSFTGLFLIAVSLGSFFWKELTPFSLYLLMAQALLLFIYISSLMKHQFHKTKPSVFLHLVGLCGLMSMLLLLGQQSPQLPFKEILLMIGLACTVPLLFHLKELKKAFK